MGSLRQFVPCGEFVSSSALRFAETPKNDTAKPLRVNALQQKKTSPFSSSVTSQCANLLFEIPARFMYCKHFEMASTTNFGRAYARKI